MAKQHKGQSEVGNGKQLERLTALIREQADQIDSLKKDAAHREACIGEMQVELTRKRLQITQMVATTLQQTQKEQELIMKQQQVRLLQNTRHYV